MNERSPAKLSMHIKTPVNSRHHGYNSVAKKLDQVVGEETQTREQPS